MLCWPVVDASYRKSFARLQCGILPQCHAMAHPFGYAHEINIFGIDGRRRTVFRIKLKA